MDGSTFACGIFRWLLTVLLIIILMKLKLARMKGVNRLSFGYVCKDESAKVSEFDRIAFRTLKLRENQISATKSVHSF